MPLIAVVPEESIVAFVVPLTVAELLPDAEKSLVEIEYSDFAAPSYTSAF